MNLSRAITLGMFLLLPVHSPNAQERPQTPDDQQSSQKFVPFEEFLERVKAAKFEEFRRAPGSRVESAEEFEDMRAHILRRYEGVKPEGSFVLDGQYADCVSIESQPSVRDLAIRKIASPPIGSTFGVRKEVRVPGEFRYAESPLKLGLKDRFGHSISCHAGTIPLGRILLEKLVRYRTLSDFFAKVPRDLGRAHIPRDKPEFLPDWEATHLHAYASQNVANFGGNSWLNLWNPTGDFSLSQQWYTSGSGSSTQTVEGGWQVLPDKYGTSNAVLFIYWTADNYQKTGCYNTDCSGFVQTNHNWFLGGTWNHYSTPGGDQWGFELQWKLYSGNWWLFLKGPGNYEAVGYLPTSVYSGGQNSRNATSVIYGGETTRKTGNSWPQMGSGEFASQGWQHAAYQNTIFYISRDENDGVGVWADMTTTDEAFSTCYTINLTPASSGGNWGTYIFFGGPGGATCN